MRGNDNGRNDVRRIVQRGCEGEGMGMQNIRAGEMGQEGACLGVFRGAE